MPKIQSNYLHLIITQYNVGLYGSRAQQIDPKEWMVHRLPLFTNYCLPSILNQSCQDFIWLVLFDERTPRLLLDQVVPLLSEPNILFGLIKPGRSYYRMKDFISKFVPKTVRFLVTQQHDNDDFLATNYIEQVQEALKESRDLPYILDTDLTYILKEEVMKVQAVNAEQQCPNPDYATPFYVVVEERQEALTCMHIGHMKVRQHVPRYFIVKGLHNGCVVHGKNISLRDRDGGTVITLDTILRLTEQFGISPERLTGLWQLLQS